MGYLQVPLNKSPSLTTGSLKPNNEKRILFMPKSWFIAALAVLSISGLADAAEVNSTMLLYRRADPGGQPYTSRVLVTANYMRMDNGRDDGDFILFDRQARVIHSVVHSERTVLDIAARKITVQPPMKLHLGAERVASRDMPAVAGRAPVHYRLTVNGKLCYDVVAVPGLLDDAVAARREYRQVLAGEQARTVNSTPADIQDPCDLATNTFAPTRQLSYGLPIQESDAAGFQQSLIDFNPAYPVDERLFTLPDGYIHYTTDHLPP